MHRLVVEDSKLGFSSSHFIAGHENCERLHGHNYRISLELAGELDEEFMVMDFKEVKDKACRLCNALDHRVILPARSESVLIREVEGQIEVRSKGKVYSFPREDCVLLPIRATTAEEIARYLYGELKKELPKLARVSVAESEGSMASYTGSEEE